MPAAGSTESRYFRLTNIVCGAAASYIVISKNMPTDRQYSARLAQHPHTHTQQNSKRKL